MLSIKHLTYLTFAVAVAALMVMIMQSTQPSHSAVLSKQHYVLVAKEPLRVGVLVDFNQLSWKAISQSQLDAEVALITKKDFKHSSLNNKVVARHIGTNESIYIDDFISPSDSGYLTTVLAKNKRAIAISVNSQSAIAGLVQPGDWVDVMFYHSLERRDDQDAWKVAASGSSRQLVENVRLLALDKAVERTRNQSTKESNFNKQSTVTLEVSIEQAQQLYLAQNLGDLSLMLRAKDAVDTNHHVVMTEMVDVLSQFSDEQEQANMVLLKGSTQVMSSASAKKKEND